MKMSAGIFGVCNLGPGYNAAQIVREMQGKAGSVPAQVIHSDGPGWALAVSPLFGAGGIGEDDEVVLAWYGRPRWKDGRSTAATAPGDQFGRDLLNQFKTSGDDFYQAVHGTFAVAAIDKRNGKLDLAIDRIGVEPLAWARLANGAFAFSSDIDALTACPGFDRSLSHAALFNYINDYRIPGPDTIYQAASKIGPGDCLSVSRGEVRERSYWSMPYTAEAAGTPKPGEGLACLEEAVRGALGGLDGVASGTYLSGGLDSSTVTGLAARHASSITAFTIGFPVKTHDESHYARLAARHFGVGHIEYEVGPADVTGEIDALINGYDEPIGNSSVLPTFMCAKLAAENGVQTLLAGDGGDEIFAGNERYASLKKEDYYKLIPRTLRKYMLEPVLARRIWRHIPLFRQARNVVRRSRMGLADRLMFHNALWNMPLAERFSSDFLEQIRGLTPQYPIDKAAIRHPANDSLQQAMGMDMIHTLADSDLRKVRRSAHLAGVEVRFPMLDDKLVAFAAGIPSDVLMPGLKLRGYFKKEIENFLPGEIIHKKKHGFGLPVAQWLADDSALNEKFLHYVRAFGERRILAPDMVANLTDSPKNSNRGDFQGMIWDVGVLEMWLQLRGL